jgi:hypothetical protein
LTAGLASALAAVVSTAAHETGAATAQTPAATATAAAPAPGKPHDGTSRDGFKLYPGATEYTPPETAETKQFVSQLRPGTTITAYFTSDPFGKVVAFYRGIGKEYPTPKSKAERLPNGQRIEKAFLIFDGAADPIHSLSWARIQHPFIGSISQKGTTPEYKDVRDVTEIVVTVRKAVPKEKKESGPSRSR